MKEPTTPKIPERKISRTTYLFNEKEIKKKLKFQQNKTKLWSLGSLNGCWAEYEISKEKQAFYCPHCELLTVIDTRT